MQDALSLLKAAVKKVYLKKNKNQSYNKQHLRNSFRFSETSEFAVSLVT